MFGSAFILCFAALLLICVYHSNKFVKIIGMYFFIIAVNLIVGTFYLSRVALYTVEYDMDYWLISKLVNMRIPHTTVVRLFNAAFSAYMLGAVLFVNYLKRLPWWGNLLMIIPPIYFYIFNEPIMGRMLHIEIYTSSGLRYQFFEQLVYWSNLVNKIMTAVYLLMPILVSWFAFRQTNVWVRKKDVIVSGISIAIINAFVFFQLIHGIYYNIMFDNVSFVRLPLDYMQRSHSDVMLAVMWIAILMIVAMILFLKPYSIFDSRNFLMRRLEWKQINKNLGMILHSYKNAFLGIHQQFALTQININKSDYEKALVNVEQGRKITEEYMAALENTLRLLKSIHVEFEPINLVTCVQEAMNRVAVKSKAVEIGLQCEESEVRIRGDYYHVTEMILNLLMNAVYAVEMKKRGEAADPIADLRGEGTCSS